MRNLTSIEEQQEKMKSASMDACAGAALGLGCATSRPKDWGELSIEEKIERCRENIKGQQRMSEQIWQLKFRLEMLEQKFNVHQHGADQGCVLPAGVAQSMNQHHDNSLAKQYVDRDVDPDKVYF